MGDARFDSVFDISRHRADAVIRCRCGHEKRVSGREMVRQFGAVAIRDAERRLKCSVCREKSATITPIPAATR
jgi:hypothetical protein